MNECKPLAWAKASGCPWVEQTCPSALAARGGRLEALGWARDYDCPWGQGTCADAASGGHLEVLRWAREHGKGLHSSTFRLNLCVFCGIEGIFRVHIGGVCVRGY